MWIVDVDSRTRRKCRVVVVPSATASPNALQCETQRNQIRRSTFATASRDKFQSAPGFQLERIFALFCKASHFHLYRYSMAFVQNQASSSKSRPSAKGKPSNASAKSRGGKLVKTNHLKRQKVDAELSELQSSVDNYVS